MKTSGKIVLQKKLPLSIIGGHGLGAEVLKLRISTFLMDFGFLNLEFGNQIWKFMCSYYDKFSGQFSKIANFLEFEFSND